MTAFSTFAYAKKYFVSQELEFVTEPDIEFSETYKPPQDLINLLADNLIVYDKVGIGTSTPTSNLTVNGSALFLGISTFEQDIRLKGALQDKFANKGTSGQVLLSDGSSVFWGDISGVGTPLQTIGIYDENVFQGTVANLNFLDGTDPDNLVSATIGITSAFANIVISDRWSLSGSDIYRMSKVGIQNSSPVSTLDITGTLHATGAVDFDLTLNVDGATTLNDTLDVDLTSRLRGLVTVDAGIVPDSDEGAYLGTAALPFSDAHIGEIRIADGANDNTIDTATGNLNLDAATNLVNVQADLDVDGTLNVDGATTLNDTLDVDLTSRLGGLVTVDTGIVPDSDEGAYLGTAALPFSDAHIGEIRIANSINDNTIDTATGNLNLDAATNLVNVQADLDVDGTLNVDSTSTLVGQVQVNTGIIPDSDKSAYLGNNSTAFTNAYISEVTIGSAGVADINTRTGNLNLDAATNLVNVQANLDVDGTSVFDGTIELNSSLIDVNNSTATGKFDYRLSSVGTGVSWRPPGVETQNTIWVTKDGNDSNSGFLEGDAKATVGAAASVAQSGDTIVIRPGVYTENNPIGLRTDVTITGQDLRLVTITPLNLNKDVFHVRRGCLIENINFAGSSVAVAHTGCAAVAFPPTNPANYAVTGYIAPGPANEGPTGRWRSPYIRNCTNFMTKSIGMKINGDHATVNDPINNIGNDLKCMVCDSFTQYNEAGIGVSITNNGYAQLVSIFTINCDIGIYADSGGSCDLTNSNSSFGNFGLVAVGLGSTEFTGIVSTYPPTRTQPGVDAGSDKVTFANMKDNINNIRRPYDGQALFFKINLDNYPDAQGTGILQAPMVQIQEIKVTNGGSGYSPATPPTVFIYDDNDESQQPKGPQGIIAELSPTIDEVTGAITAIDVVNSGRNYLPTQNLKVFIDGGTATADVVTQPIYYAVDSATETTLVTGITTVTFNEFIPYELFGGEEISLKRISRILTSSHSFEYIGTGTDINTSTPFKGGVSIKENEIVALDGAQIPFTSTDQKGNFDIGEGFQINQPSATIRGRDFSKAIQAEVTPLILALR
jgi:hypothetical protein